VSLLLIAVAAHALFRHATAVADRGPGPSVRRQIALAVGAAAAGLLLARWIAGALEAPFVGRLAPLFDVQQGFYVVLATLAAATVIGVTVGLVARAFRERIAGSRRLRWALVTAELGVATVLIVFAAGPFSTLVQSAANGQGFLTAGGETIDLGTAGFGQAARTRVLDASLERARAVPGVDDATLTFAFPTLGRYWAHAFRIGSDVPYRLANSTAVAPGYTERMGIPLLEGRRLNADDSPRSPDVAVVNETFARRHAPGGTVIGKRVEQRFGESFEIVGVVADVRQDGAHAPTEPIVYRPYSQCAGTGAVTLALWTDGRPGVAHDVAVAIRSLDAAIPVGEPTTAREIVRASRAPLWFEAAWLALLATVALAMAMFDLAGLLYDGLERRLVRPVAFAPLAASRER
jgi:hypothetical protein